MLKPSPAILVLFLLACAEDPVGAPDATPDGRNGADADIARVDAAPLLGDSGASPDARPEVAPCITVPECPDSLVCCHGVCTTADECDGAIWCIADDDCPAIPGMGNPVCCAGVCTRPADC